MTTCQHCEPEADGSHEVECPSHPRAAELREARQRDGTGLCRQRHHDTYGEVIVCLRPGCEEPLVCGPFYHACRRCQPAMFARCGICGARRVDCTC